MKRRITHRKTPGTEPQKTSKRVRARVWMFSLAAVLLIGVVAVEVFTDFDFRKIPQAMGQLNPFLVLVLTATLPIAGFPISVVYLVLGATFGPYIGFCAVLGITTVHLVGTHLVANSFLRAPLQRWLDRKHYKVPEVPSGEEAAIVTIAILMPVLPYFLRNYLLSLSGIPLRLYLLVGVPLYTLRSGVTLFLGDLSGEPNRKGFIILGAIYAVKLSICAVLVWWLRKRHKSVSSRTATLGAKSKTQTLATPAP